MCTNSWSRKMPQNLSRYLYSDLFPLFSKYMYRYTPNAFEKRCITLGVTYNNLVTLLSLSVSDQRPCCTRPQKLTRDLWICESLAQPLNQHSYGP